ncbi:YciI-like protein [Ruegeria denitrificans]|uniref:YciI-like protein n=1 Tax=Ruegeria denitrificans TaxID=1715692 RepID=A0A0P1IBF2_9RHOB|nr:YciI family protein [Ruegeria denitrificans]CUK03146.1 YciI-like protein [Ruegeria denitrificans]
MSIIPEGGSLFVVDIEYTVPMDKVAAVIDPHMDFVRASYEAGRFLMSGPKVPRTGGLIVMTADSREDAESYLEQDPFAQEKVAKFRVTEFRASNLHPTLKA